LALAMFSLADVPMIITYQGILYDSGSPVTGDHSINFALYDSASGGSLLWDETQLVSFSDGYFTVELGTSDTLDLDFSQQYWLGIAIDGGDELSPRTSTTSSAFSIRAKYVEKLTESNINQFWQLMQTMTDADGDGYDKISAGGDDCDDMNPYINPGATELCDGIDNNCDGQTDNGADSDCLPLPPNVAQVSCVAGECVIIQCTEGYSDTNGVYEDGCESDCILVYNDGDCDGWISSPPPTPVCEANAGPCYEYVDSAQIGDCDDGSPDINPDADEDCNAIDDDCDGQTDEGLAGYSQPCSVSNEYGTCYSTIYCEPGYGWPTCDAPIPGPEQCDGLDNDCDGETDEGGVCLSEGDLIITEIMQNPDTVSDAEGEWFEIYNTTGSTIDLQGVTFQDNYGSFTVNEYLPISPGGYLTFARSNSPGFEPDYNYNGALSLANSSDELYIYSGPYLIDAVVYDDGATFPDPTGASMNLDPSYFDHVSNNNGANWCEASTSYNGDLGTPGSANDTCTAR
jgi:hypothetical protein